MRFTQGVIKPMKGWASGLTGTLTGNPRAAHAWLDNSGAQRAAFATHSKLATHDGTTLTDSTYSGFPAGDANTSQWTLDNFGEVLVACNDSSQKIYEWTPGGGASTIVTNAPNAYACFVTEERFLIAIGASSDPRKVAWPDQETRTIWTPTSTNQAGDLPIQSAGIGMCGAKIRGGGLIWTTEDIHLLRYIGRPDVYGLERVGDECGIVGRHAFRVVNNEAYWWGRNTIWKWAGYLQKLPCDIGDDIFNNLNTTYQGKIWTEHVAEHNEIWFFYPRGSATECSHAAIYNYVENTWNHTAMPRNCGFPMGVFSWPVRVDSSGAMWKHETAFSYSGGGNRMLKTGPLEIGAGGSLLFIDEIIPDELVTGNCEVYFYTREYPEDSETTLGPYSNQVRIPVETAARFIRMEIRGASGTSDFRIGTYRAIVRPWSGF
jgi:hypothetical protein